MNESASTGTSAREGLRELILSELRREYISRSCQDEIETGNHYQSIRLGDELTEGFRSSRLDVLDELAFEGRSVLDLGSNLGETSRAARERGATLVDGFEYDQYFVDLANLINAYNGTTRVSFYQRDITNPATFPEPYDIVMALAVFVYIRPVMETVAGITRDAFILETHRIDDNLESYYLSAVLPYFPAYTKLRETEWGLPHAEEPVRRAIFAFARDQATLDAIVRR
jgi:SAM-dependent methyltransferase